MKAKFTGEKFEVLTDHGYSFSMIEGGWISPDRATIVSQYRSPYQREIMQYSYNEEAHEKNLTALVDAGLAERGQDNEKRL